MTTLTEAQVEAIARRAVGMIMESTFVIDEKDDPRQVAKVTAQDLAAKVEADAERLLRIIAELSKPRPADTPVIYPANPLPGDIDWGRVEGLLGVELRSPLTGRKIVDHAGLGEREPDLLGAVGQEVDGLGQCPDIWVGVGLEGQHLGGCDLHLTDALPDHLGARLHMNSSTRGRPESVLRITVEVQGAGANDSRACTCGGAL